MSVRLFVAGPLPAGAEFALPESAARHAQVRRVQPGDTVTLFDGSGVEVPARVQVVGRQEVHVRLGEPVSVQRELPVAVTLAVGMPTNERMDALVEKASELGAAELQPLLCERSVLRLEGERAERRRLHWQAIAIAACEQCGRARVTQIAPVQTLPSWLSAQRGAADARGRWMASFAPAALPIAALAATAAWRGRPLTLLSGPEGGFSPTEEAAACDAGFEPLSLGPRVLRADTAPLAMLAALGLAFSEPG